MSSTFHVASIIMQPTAVVICGCKNTLVVINGVGVVAACPSCGQQFSITKIHYDTAAQFQSHEPQTYLAREFTVSSRMPLIVPVTRQGLPS